MEEKGKGLILERIVEKVVFERTGRSKGKKRVVSENVIPGRGKGCTKALGQEKLALSGEQQEEWCD